jgi:hypothetical protein
MTRSPGSRTTMRAGHTPRRRRQGPRRLGPHALPLGSSPPTMTFTQQGKSGFNSYRELTPSSVRLRRELRAADGGGLVMGATAPQVAPGIREVGEPTDMPRTPPGCTARCEKHRPERATDARGRLGRRPAAGSWWVRLRLKSLRASVKSENLPTHRVSRPLERRVAKNYRHTASAARINGVSRKTPTGAGDDGCCAPSGTTWRGRAGMTGVARPVGGGGSREASRWRRLARAQPALALSGDGAAAFERATEGDLVGVLQVPADREAGGEAGDLDLEGGQQA